MFDAKVAAVPADRLGSVPTTGGHSAKDIVAHITAYERLIVERLRAAREGRTTAFDRDRDGWESFNERVWAEAAGLDAASVLANAREVFGQLLREVKALSDEELREVTGITEHVDPAWLDGRAMWELIGIDAFDHYPMHYPALEAAARAD